MHDIEKHSFKKVIKENIIYFITMTVCIALFYGFVSIGDAGNLLIQGNEEYDFSLYAPMIRYCIYAVSIAIFILISYVNTYMFQEKLKEISILITLGMKRSKIAIIYSRDMFLISMMSFVIGVILGVGCSYIVNLIISYMAYNSIVISFKFYVDTFVATLIFFTIMYAGMIIINVIKVTYKKPLDLLNDNKIPDEKKISKIKQAFELILLVCCYCFIGYNFKTYFSIGRNYSGNIPDYESNKFQLAIFVAIIMAIFLTIKIINYVVIWIKQRKFICYKTELFVFGRLSYRLKSVTGNMFLVTLVLTLSLCGFSLIPLMAEFSKEYMEHRMVYDINIPFNYDNIEVLEDIPKVDYDFVKAILSENEIEIENECVLEQYFVWETDFSGPSTRMNKYDMPRLAMGISDYNQLRIMAGYEPIVLEEDCFLFHVKDDIDISQFEEALEEGAHSIKVADFLLEQNENCFLLNENLGGYIYNTNTDSFLVFPDEVCETLFIAKTGYYANTVEKMPYVICKEIDAKVQTEFRDTYLYLYDKYSNNENSAIGFVGPIRFRSIEENDIVFMAIITKAVGMYIGIVFMLICMAMVSIRNVMECKNSIKDYCFLRQIGISKKQIIQINIKENLFFYFLPYIISIINFVLIQYTFMMRFGTRANVYFQGHQYVNGIFIPVVIASLILIIYIISAQIMNYYEIKNSIYYIKNERENSEKNC